jgi:hypothetical protein
MAVHAIYLARLFTTRNHKDTTMYHKPRIPQGTTKIPQGYRKESVFFHKDTPDIPASCSDNEVVMHFPNFLVRKENWLTVIHL